MASNTAHMRGREGVEVAARSTSVYTIENGLISRLQMFQERAEALEAVGLSEQRFGREAALCMESSIA